MIRIAAVIAFAAWAAAAAAKPSSVASVFGELDLFGLWASNCAAPATPDDPHVTISMPEPGVVIESHDFGAGYEMNRYGIVAARRLSGHRLALDVLFEQAGAEPDRELIVMEVNGHTRRTMLTKPEGKAPLVLDGIAVATGRQTPQLKKCD